MPMYFGYEDIAFHSLPRFQLLTKYLVKFWLFPYMTCSLFVHCPCTLFPDPWKVGATWLSQSSHLTVECYTWLSGSEAAFCPNNKTYIQPPIPRVAFVSSHTAALTPRHLAVLFFIYVKWPEVPLAMVKGKVRVQCTWSVRVSLRTRLSLLLLLPYSLQWSSAGTLIPTLKRIVFSQFLIKV